MPKCVRLGWLLPYVPRDREYGAWKAHYIRCLRSLNVERHEQEVKFQVDINSSKKKTLLAILVEVKKILSIFTNMQIKVYYKKGADTFPA